MIRLFCRIYSLLWVSFTKETYNLKEPTNRRHPIAIPMSDDTSYGVATISRLLQIIRLFCRIQSLLWGSFASFATETYHFKEPPNRGHPIPVYVTGPYSWYRWLVAVYTYVRDFYSCIPVCVAYLFIPWLLHMYTYVCCFCSCIPVYVTHLFVSRLFHLYTYVCD